MSSPILPIQSIALPELPKLTEATAGTGEFQQMLESSIGQVEQKQGEANVAIGQFLSGENEDLHTAALSAQRAELSMELFLQVRNKAVSAYQEIMRMQM